jgi:uncharacterized protein YlzI (FlbEa/FlbD family)
MKNKLKEYLKTYIIPEDIDEVVNSILKIVEQSQAIQKPKRKPRQVFIATRDPYSNETSVATIESVPQGTIPDQEVKGVHIAKPDPDRIKSMVDDEEEDDNNKS